MPGIGSFVFEDRIGGFIHNDLSINSVGGNIAAFERHGINSVFKIYLKIFHPPKVIYLGENNHHKQAICLLPGAYIAFAEKIGHH